MLTTVFTIALSIFICTLGFLVYASSRQEEVNKKYFIFSIVLAFWVMGNYLGSNFKGSPASVFATSIDFFIGPITAFCFLMLVLSFEKTSNDKIIKSSAFVSMLLSLFSLTPFVYSLRGSRIYDNSTISYGKGYWIYALGIFSIVLVAIFRLKDLYNKKPEDRKRIGSLIAGLAIGGGAIMGANLLTPLIISSESANLLLGNASYVGILIFLLIVARAIIIHRLFDIRLVMVRVVGYFGVLTILSSVYVFIVFGVFERFAGVQSLSNYQKASFVFLLVIFSMSLQTFKRIFDRVSNKIFFHDVYDSQEMIRQLNEVLISTVDIDKLLRRSAEIISKTIKIEFCLFGIKPINNHSRRIIGYKARHFNESDIARVQELTPLTRQKIIITDNLTSEHKELRDLLVANDVSVIVRLVDTSSLKHAGMGYLVLGGKLSGNRYSSQDIGVLKIIADEYLIAVHNVLQFEEIEQFGKTMERKVAQATYELQKTNDRLKALDETKDEFISMASHQLRTPLTSVKGYLSMVLEGDAGKLNKTQRSMLDQAYFSSQRMVYLISDLLNVSRLRTGKFVIDYAPTNLSDIVSQEVSQLDVVLKNHDLKLVYDPPEDMPLINLDETKIRQVIMNFIDNAIYYTPSGGTITLSLTNTDKEVHFTVTDTGIGVPKSEQHQLFTKFFRAHNARRARPDGTGLGLFMAKKVIIAQNGSLIFRSKEGKGSTFGFIFPVV